MNFATLNGTNLHYRSDGDPQGTPLVLIHSLGTDLRLWDDLIPRLDPTLRLVRFDLRGHGLSADPAGELTLVDFSADIAALLDHLEIDKAVTSRYLHWRIDRSRFRPAESGTGQFPHFG